MSKWQSERSIHEMLKDTPPLRESSDSITSGTEAKFPTSRSMPFPPAYAPPDVSQNGGAGTSTLLRAGSTKLDAIRNWGVSTYKCTKQILYEKLGKSSRTVDTELEAQICMVRETQRKYGGVLRLSAALAQQLGAAAATQRALGDAFAELAQKSPELQNQFLYNADTQRTLTRNGEILLAALHFFNNSLNTLTNKTIEDTLLTIRQYEAARVEYDAYRSELEASGGNPPELLLTNIERHRRHYERLRDDSAVKLKLLHENRAESLPARFPPLDILAETDAEVYHQIRAIRQSGETAPATAFEMLKRRARRKVLELWRERLKQPQFAHKRVVDAFLPHFAQRLQRTERVTYPLTQVKVMNKQLLLFHNAVSAYFSGNNVALEAAVRHFNIHPPPVTPSPPAPTPALSAALAAAAVTSPAAAAQPRTA